MNSHGNIKKIIVNSHLLVMILRHL